MEREKFVIVAEDICLIQGHNFVNMVCLLLSFYYTLNIAYPKELCYTLKFLQKFFVKITDRNMPQKIFSLYKKLVE